jgi:transcriptional regulator with XRE-family HTH domain
MAADDMQNFAGLASKTLRGAHAENCAMVTRRKARGTNSSGDRGRYNVAHRPDAGTLPVVRTFCANVRALLIEAQEMKSELTQARLAKEAKISLRTLAEYVSGSPQYAPNLRVVHDIANAMGVEAWQLLFPDFPAQLVLNPSIRGKVHQTIERYLHALPAARAAMDDMAAVLPQRTKDSA